MTEKTGDLGQGAEESHRAKIEILQTAQKVADFVEHDVRLDNQTPKREKTPGSLSETVNIFLNTKKITPKGFSGRSVKESLDNGYACDHLD